MMITKDKIREVGGIANSDDNVFFTNIGQISNLFDKCKYVVTDNQKYTMPAEPKFLQFVLLSSDLHLDNVTLDSDGKLLSGRVINGQWILRSNGTHLFAYRDWGDLLNPVTVYPIGELKLILVPRHLIRCLDSHSSFDAVKEIEPLTKENFKEKIEAELLVMSNEPKIPLSGFADFDDDIPF